MDKFDLLKDIFSALEIKIDNRYDISNLILRQETLRCKNLIDQLNEKVPNLKTFYNSSKLTCLHKNSLNKQKFPAVNMFRQILKCNSFKMEPYVISKGYDKFSGKKIVERYYKMIDLNLAEVSNQDTIEVSNQDTIEVSNQDTIEVSNQDIIEVSNQYKNKILDRIETQSLSNLQPILQPLIN